MGASPGPPHVHGHAGEGKKGGIEDLEMENAKRRKKPSVFPARLPVGGKERPHGEGAEAAALALLPARLLRRQLPAAVGRQAAPEALERAERGKDEALHGGTCRKVS